MPWSFRWLTRPSAPGAPPVASKADAEALAQRHEQARRQATREILGAIEADDPEPSLFARLRRHVVENPEAIAARKQREEQETREWEERRRVASEVIEEALRRRGAVFPRDPL